MSLGLNQSLLSTVALNGGNKLLPAIDSNLKSWCTTPTTDGKTLSNIQGTSVNLKNVNCLQFNEGGAADYVALTNDITTTTTWTNELDVNWSDFGNNSSGVSFLSADDQTRWWRINGVDGNSLFIEGKMGNTSFREINISSDVSLSLNVTYRIKTVWSGTSVALYIDGVLKNTYSWGNNVESNTFGNIGRPTATSGTAKISNWKFYHNGILEAHLPLAEGTGTDAYDVSGKGNHGTIVNSTWTTANGMESWNHEYGFNDDYDVKVPALNFKSKQVVTTDGSDDEIVFPSAMDFEDDKQYSVTLTFDPTAGTDTTFFASSTSSLSRFAISMANGDASKLVVTVRQSSSTTLETPIASIPSGMITITASWDGSSTLTASYVDSGGSTTNFTSSSETGVTSGTARTTLGCRSSLSQHSIAKYLLLTVTKDNTVLGSYDFQSDLGSTTIQDTTANNNDGTITTGSGGTAAIWAQRVADTAGSIVSADYAANNTTISNPAGVVHNGSECGFETGLQELTSTEIFAIDNSGQQLFTRKIGTEITQFFEYEAGLTGNDLTRTTAYVG